MPAPLDRARVRRHLQSLNLRELFINELGWDHGGEDLKVTVAGRTFVLEAVAHKRGLVAYRYLGDSDAALPGHPVRQKIERVVAGRVREHLVVYATSDPNTQYWQWVKREAGRPDRTRSRRTGGRRSGGGSICARRRSPSVRRDGETQRRRAAGGGVGGCRPSAGHEGG